MLTAWLIYGREEAEYNKHYIALYFEEGRKRNIRFRLVIAEKLYFGTRDGELYIRYHEALDYGGMGAEGGEQDLLIQGCKGERPDFAICRIIYPLISMQLEGMGIPVFNCAKTAGICNDKARTYQYLAGMGIQMIDTRFCRRDYAAEQIRGLEAVIREGGKEGGLCRYVVKTVDGHGGGQVYLLENGNGEEIIRKAGGSDLVIQPLVGSRRQDLRVYVVGSQIVGAVLRTAKSDFRSNYSLGGDVRLYQLSAAEIAVVEKIVSCFTFGMAGIDFIIGDNGELIFNEIEDVVGARMLYQCMDINLVGIYLDSVLESLNK